jgi:PilZ domain-containing protein
MEPAWMNETPTEPILHVTQLEVRRAMRRALTVDCEVVSVYWDEPLQHIATDLSPFGMWIDTLFPLHRGAELVVCFTPPRGETELMLFARVTRVVSRLRDGGRIGMGLEFVAMDDAERAVLSLGLRGIPPRLLRRAA